MVPRNSCVSPYDIRNQDGPGVHRFDVVGLVERMCFTLSGPESRLGDKSVQFEVIPPRNGTAVLQCVKRVNVDNDTPTGIRVYE